MRTSQILCLFWSVLQFVYGKGTAKDSNVIAIFSEDDLSGRLPNPKSIAAEIPKTLILQKQKKLRIADSSDKIIGAREKKINDKKLVRTSEKDRNNKKKPKREVTDEFDNFDDRKSKSMVDREYEDDEASDTFIVVETMPFTFQPSAQISIPTATAVSIIGTEISRDLLQIGKIDTTTLSQRDESPKFPPQKRRQFTPRSRLNVKRANSSSDRVTLFNYKIIISILLGSIFIMNI